MVPYPGSFPGGIMVALNRGREQTGRGDKRNEKINSFDDNLRSLTKLGLQWLCGRIVGIYNRSQTGHVLYPHSWFDRDFRGNGLRFIFFPMDGGSKEEECLGWRTCFYGERSFQRPLFCRSSVYAE